MDELNQQLCSAVEKHETENREKDGKISESMQRIGELENANKSMEEMLQAINESSQGKDDQIQTINNTYQRQVRVGEMK